MELQQFNIVCQKTGSEKWFKRKIKGYLVDWHPELKLFVYSQSINDHWGCYGELVLSEYQTGTAVVFSFNDEKKLKENFNYLLHIKGFDKFKEQIKKRIELTGIVANK